MSRPTCKERPPKDAIKNEGEGGQKNQKSTTEDDGLHQWKSSQSPEKHGPQHQPACKKMAGQRGGEFIGGNFLLRHELIVKKDPPRQGGSSMPVTGLEPVTSRV